MTIEEQRQVLLNKRDHLLQIRVATGRICDYESDLQMNLINRDLEKLFDSSKDDFMGPNFGLGD